MRMNWYNPVTQQKKNPLVLLCILKKIGILYYWLFYYDIENQKEIRMAPVVETQQREIRICSFAHFWQYIFTHESHCYLDSDPGISVFTLLCTVSIINEGKPECFLSQRLASSASYFLRRRLFSVIYLENGLGLSQLTMCQSLCLSVVSSLPKERTTIQGWLLAGCSLSYGSRALCQS